MQEIVRGLGDDLMKFQSTDHLSHIEYAQSLVDRPRSGAANSIELLGAIGVEGQCVKAAYTNAIHGAVARQVEADDDEHVSHHENRALEIVTFSFAVDVG